MDRLTIVNNILNTYSTLNKIDLYKEQGATELVINILIKRKELGNPKKFGILMEDIAQTILGLDDSDNSEHDKKFGEYKLEIKTSTLLMNRLVKGFKTFQYNSIRIDYDYDFLILQNIDIDGLHYYILSKEQVKELARTIFKNQKKIKIGIIEMMIFEKVKDMVFELTENNIEEYFMNIE